MLENTMVLQMTEAEYLEMLQELSNTFCQIPSDQIGYGLED